MERLLGIKMKICLLGASGSIGSQTLDIISKNPTDFELVGFSVGKRIECVSTIINTYNSVKYICVQNEEDYLKLKESYPNISFFYGDDGLCEIIKASNAEMVVNALVGFAGLKPSITALESNLLLALANKESLVVGGEIINNFLKEGKGKLYPIDSEHSALWKCLKVDDQDIERLIVTASGGAFRKLSREELKDVTPEDALKHPTWDMGNKITIDCATMMNKAFELIEAYYLFGYDFNKLGVVLHDESELHSCVLYNNGLYRGELNKPDMRNPIKFALYEGNISFDTVTFNSFDELKGLHFHEFDIKRYPIVSLAKEVMDKKGNFGAIVNAANEVAVRAFLDKRISYYELENIVLDSINYIKFIAHPTLEELIETDALAREYAERRIAK